MADRFKYDKVRQEIIDMLKDDLMGPLDENEVLKEYPRGVYIIGMLAPQSSLRPAINEQEIDTDVAYDKNSDYTAVEDDDDDPADVGKLTVPSSIGISFYIESSTPAVNFDISWGDYIKRTDDRKIDKDGNETGGVSYGRIPMKETVTVKFADFPKRSKEYHLTCDTNVCLHVSRIALKKGYSLVSAYVINRRNNPEDDVESFMFQVNIKAYAPDKSAIFIAEHKCRDVLALDEYYFEQRPIFGRGRGCAATWGEGQDGKTSYIESDFIPQYEIPWVSAALPGFDPAYFSMRFMAVGRNKNETINKLNTLADTYEKWIRDTLMSYPEMASEGFREKIGNDVVGKCQTALARIREGIMLLANDDKAFDAFCFMNRAMLLQRSIANYAKEHGAGIECSFRDFIDPSKGNDFTWYPFQIAFILINLNGIVNPMHKDREIVDLLYFPTGGGKTEAYLGLMAFVIASRRLRINSNDTMNRDGGVTIILRYTLRLLTTQQRDRIIKMIIAAEWLRKEEVKKGSYKYGKEPITIGFWVGSGLTPNGFDDLKENSENAARNRNLIYRQILTCPFCGAKLTKDEFYIDTEKKSVEIYCPDEHCIFYKYPGRDPKKDPEKDRNKMPVYLVDEEIYARCPTVILSTVDKFAALPWTVGTNALFGKVNGICSRHGYIAIGTKHPARHNATPKLREASTTPVKPFCPPELIVQDELHLITGPLGTIYGAYETIIENLCLYKEDGKVIRPKYIVSTATIKNAGEQTKCLYARKNFAQFPPNGFKIGDSLFIREIPVSEKPFRKYVGIAALGQSLKTPLLRIYAILLQAAHVLSNKEECKDFIDPYYTLVGYYNTIRELGGTVRLMQDDIPKRLKQIRTRHGMAEARQLRHKVEITSRMASHEIPNKLKQLETKRDSDGCLDIAVATNMIAVGMDVDRLGLMVVSGQPKQNSEYIQATSRIGRTYPGLVVTQYNPYRPRDLSHYENFIGYHAQMYRFVEGTTATPFSARARDRVLHALIIAAIRLHYSKMAPNDGASLINELSDDKIRAVKDMILARLNIVKPEARQDTEEDIDTFIDNWKHLTYGGKGLRYYVKKTGEYNSLMNEYGESVKDTEKPTLRSMRDVEKAANMYYYRSAEDQND